MPAGGASQFLADHVANSRERPGRLNGRAWRRSSRVSQPVILQRMMVRPGRRAMSG